MWGLLLALAACAPACAPGLVASGTPVLGLAPPGTTKASFTTPAQRSSSPGPAGKENGTTKIRIVKKKKVIVKKQKKIIRTRRPVTTKLAETPVPPKEQKPDCPPLGLESLRVSDSQFEASSSQSFGLGPHRGRLNIQSGLEDGDHYDGAWCAEQQDVEPWFQVDAGHPTRFSGVITQGRNSIWRFDWVTSYKVQFSNDSRSWWGSKNSSGMDVIFPANSDQETPVLNLLPEHQVARYIRLLPQTWLPGGAPCLRAEILACPVSDPNGLLPKALALASSDPLDFRHHNYKDMRKLMKEVNEQCPNITRVYNIGKSHQGLKLYVMEMSDNPGEHELMEPEVRYVAGMHGNEVLGRELLLLLMQFLCREYLRGNPRVTRLLTEMRLHLLPSMNPDGYELAYQRGSELAGWVDGRWNYQGIDLNHNFADLNTPLWTAEDDGLVPHTVANHHLPLPAYYTLPNATVAPETRAVIEWMKRIPFVLSANLHGGELVVSYPYDMTRTPWAARELTPTPDDAVFRWLSTVYADTNRVMQNPERRACHNQDFALGGNIINGADWHTVPGSMNDFSYLHTNCFEVTIELSCDKFPHESELPQEWENNKDALLTYLEQVRMAIVGVVRDKDTEQGIADAVISVEGINHDVTTAWDGDYWRLLTPGDYTVTASAEGYHSVTRNCRVTFEEGPFPCNFHLTKTPKQRLRELLAAGAKVPPDLQRRLERLRKQKN
ncbi:PREDICTED: probable carboxypeptidase X1 isoform X1 [Elephantulus edwardii]|uniref:probable carboxypeptidase X1 isoform X1 n=1 Tax=Elephantulus edwardii TaxID=28737 RepID=UPI0003F07A87|nr:PREDICTED: probable carboxypeptidase X1 isoform X1 [Elephantulus edwardii]